MTDKDKILETLKEHGKRKTLLDQTIKNLEIELAIEQVDEAFELYDSRLFSKLLLNRYGLPFLVRAFPSNQINFFWDDTFIRPQYSIGLTPFRNTFEDNYELSKRTIDFVSLMAPDLLKISAATGRFSYQWIYSTGRKIWVRMECEAPDFVGRQKTLPRMEGSLQNVLEEVVNVHTIFPYVKLGGPRG